jgi:predicted MFS family arabinose efflux permease
VVPVREVASWRSYVNIAATTGRAVGGPLGGVLCDTIGWRWCFYGQVPPTIIGLLLILWKLPNKTAKATTNPDEDASFKRKLERIDVAGAIVLMVTIVSFLLSLEFANQGLPITYSIAPIVTCLVCTVLFCLIERRWAIEPILPIELFTNRDTLTAYLLAGLQMSAQFSLFYSVPIYFQIVSGSTVGQAGLRLVPAVIGNATAGLISGYTISKTGRYKLFAIIGNICGWLGYLMVLVRWRGEAHADGMLYLFLGGFASGTNQSTTFIHLAASLDPSEMAIAGTTLYLVQNLFLLIGLQFSTAVLHARLRIGLDSGLEGVKNKQKVNCSSWAGFEALVANSHRADHQFCRLEPQVNPHTTTTDQRHCHSCLPRRSKLYLW